MKILVQNYTFNAALRQVTFSDYGSINLDDIFVIANATTGAIIYNFADPAKGGTVATNVLTLEYDTTVGMSNGDKLIIVYWDAALSSIVDGSLVNLGANNDVVVTSLPALPTGTNNIGDVDVLTLPSLPAGNANIGDVDVLTLPSLPAGTNNIGDVDVVTVPAPLSTTGGGLEATALRVTLANDSTGLVSVDDNGGSLTVDGTVGISSIAAGDNNIGNVDILSLPALPTGDNAIGRVKLTDGVDVADILDLVNSNPLTVAIVDGSGTQITSFGGGTQYTEGDIDASITGTAMMWEDSSDTVRPVSAAKPLPVNVVAGGAGDGSILDGVSAAIKATVLDYVNSNPLAVRLTDTNGDYVGAGGGTQYTEDAPASADPTGTMGMAVRADALAAVTSLDGDNIAQRATNKGELYVKHVDSIPVTDNGSSLTVDGSVGVSSIAAGDNNIGNVDVVTVPAPLSTSGGGTELAALRVTIANDSTGLVSVDDNGGSLTVDGTVTVGNASIPVTDNAGSLTVDAPVGTPVFVRLSDGAAAIATLPVSLASVPSHAVTNAGTFAVQAAGDVAHDSADSGSPVKVGAQARTTNPTAVADADRSNLITDKLGKLVTVQSIRDLKGDQSTTITSSVAETTIVTAGGVGIFLDLYGLIIANTSATACEVTIRDATGGGTARSIMCPAGQTVGFMLGESGAIKQATANNNWTATCGTSVASIKITALYVKNT